jgi:hypothetical protein
MAAEESSLEDTCVCACEFVCECVCTAMAAEESSLEDTSSVLTRPSARSPLSGYMPVLVGLFDSSIGRFWHY